MKQQKKNKEKIKKAETKHSQTKKSEKKKNSAEAKSVEKKTKLVKSKTKTKLSPVAPIQKEKKEKKVRIKKEVVITKPTIKLQLKDGITPQEIAQNIQQPVSKVITEFMKLGMIVSATQKSY